MAAETIVLDSARLATLGAALSLANGNFAVSIGPNEPTVPTGQSALWVQTGLGVDGDQFDLLVVTGD